MGNQELICLGHHRLGGSNNSAVLRRLLVQLSTDLGDLVFGCFVKIDVIPGQLLRHSTQIDQPRIFGNARGSILAFNDIQGRIRNRM